MTERTEENIEAPGNEDIEADLLLQGIYVKYGYDFRNYSKASLKRRIMKRLRLSGCASISEMQHLMLNDLPFFEELLFDLTVNVTEMFRDSSFFLAMRNRVLPELEKSAVQYPIKLWHAGCSTGEEVYSMAIILTELGLYDDFRIYATDISEDVLKIAREGIYPLDQVKFYTENYQKSGGTASFSDYYHAKYDNALMGNDLKRNIIFADHNLVTDGVFSEVDMVICRNVLIYFTRSLQDRVFTLFTQALSPHGFLALGSKESIRFSSSGGDFVDFLAEEKIYRKKRP